MGVVATSHAILCISIQLSGYSSIEQTAPDPQSKPIDLLAAEARARYSQTASSCGSIQSIQSIQTNRLGGEASSALPQKQTADRWSPATNCMEPGQSAHAVASARRLQQNVRLVLKQLGHPSISRAANKRETQATGQYLARGLRRVRLWTPERRPNCASH